MADIQMLMTVEEGKCLLQLLESSLQNKRVEEHRTDRAAFRELVHSDLMLIESLTQKVRQSLA